MRLRLELAMVGSPSYLMPKLGQATEGFWIPAFELLPMSREFDHDECSKRGELPASKTTLNFQLPRRKGFDCKGKMLALRRLICGDRELP